MWNEFLPISMPTTATRVLLRHGALLVFGAPCQLQSLAGQEHGRTIPLADLGSSCTGTSGLSRSVAQLALRGPRRNSVQRSTNGCLQIIELDERIRLASQFVGDHRWFAPQTGNDGDVDTSALHGFE